MVVVKFHCNVALFFILFYSDDMHSDILFQFEYREKWFGWMFQMGKYFAQLNSYKWREGSFILYSIILYIS